MMLGLRAGHIFLLSIAVISAMKNKVINKLRKLKRISNIKKKQAMQYFKYILCNYRNAVSCIFILMVCRYYELAASQRSINASHFLRSTNIAKARKICVQR